MHRSIRSVFKGRKLEDFTHYEREPIKIHSSAVIIIHLLTGYQKIQDLWMDDARPESLVDEYRRAARQFLLQLEGRSCMAFLMALRDQLNVEINAWRSQCRTSQRKMDREQKRKAKT